MIGFRVNCGNPLLYPAIVSDCLSPERGVFYISIVNLISKITLAFFTLLRASKQHSKKAAGIVDHIILKTIHWGLLVIVILQSKLRGWVIDIVFIFIFLILNEKMNIMCYCILNYNYSIIFVMFYIKMARIIVFIIHFE